MRSTVVCLVSGAALLATCMASPALAGDYVGSKPCGECHEAQYKVFITSSKKAHSGERVAIMAPKLKPAELAECYECHTTGYGRGGFVSLERTPELASLGCETCHGPGARHAASADPRDIVKPADLSACEGCHNAERTRSFKRRPMLVSGAH